jgi:hypothetical protein
VKKPTGSDKGRDKGWNEGGLGNGQSVDQADERTGEPINQQAGEQRSEQASVQSKTQTAQLAREQQKGLFQRLNDNLYEFYVAPYRRTFARAQRDEEDLFMLLVFAESLGVPNPAAYYTMELLPVVYERFHEWHKRMGIEKSPLDHVHCC